MWCKNKKKGEDPKSLKGPKKTMKRTMKTTKSVLVMLATAIIMLCLMLSTSAEEVLPETDLMNTARVQTELYGDVNTPYFSVENSTQNALAFCVESNKSHPEAGSMYISSVYEKSEEIKNNLVVWNVLINASMEEQTDMLYKVTQQALWDAIDGGNSHRAITLRRLGPDAVELYDKLFNEASWSYKVDFQFWATATDADVQVLMTYEVVELAEPTIETVEKENIVYEEVVYDTVVEVPVENIIEVEVPYDTIVEIPVENIVEVEVPYDTVVEVPMENIVYEEKIIDVVETVEVYNYITEEKVIDVIEEVEVPNYIEVEVPYDVIVEVPVENVVEIETSTEEDDVLGDEYVPEYNPEPIPQTGDTTNFVLAGIVGIIALCAFLFTIKKKEQE